MLGEASPLIRIKNKETKVLKVAYLFDHEVAIFQHLDSGAIRNDVLAILDPCDFRGGVAPGRVAHQDHRLTGDHLRAVRLPLELSLQIWDGWKRKRKKEENVNE